MAEGPAVPFMLPGSQHDPWLSATHCTSDARQVPSSATHQGTRSVFLSEYVPKDSDHLSS